MRRGWLFPLASLCLFSCSLIHHVETPYGYGTSWNMHLYEGSASDLSSLADYVSSTSPLFDTEGDFFSPKGLSALNASHDYVTLDPLVLEALGLSISLEEETGGAFCYHLGELSDLWLEHLDRGEVLPESKKAEALERARSTRVEIRGDKARRIGEGKIDLNAISKGFCLEKIGNRLSEKGFTRFLIDGGSSSILAGETGSGDGTIKVNLTDAPGRSFRAKNAAIACSSAARQGVRIGGTLYSHIVDPFTGSASCPYDAVYLCGQGPARLDAYSTASLVSPLSFGKDLEKKGISCAYVKNGEVLYASEGFLL